MTITVEADGYRVGLRTITFSGGEVQPRLLEGPEKPWHVKITAHVWSSDDLMELLLVNDACRRRWPFTARYLVIPYLPYARQDRVCYDGEAMSLGVMADLIKMCGFSGVEVWDPHSKVARENIEHLRVREAHEFVAKISVLTEDTIIVAPDEGAYGRAFRCARLKQRIDPNGPGFSSKLDNFIQAKKARSSDTGELLPPQIEWSVAIRDRDFLIVDDICDGGRTFVNLAAELKKATAGSVYLYATHGIFSAGFSSLVENIKHIFVANLHKDADIPFIDGRSPYISVLQ